MTMQTAQEHHVVVLESCHCEIPVFDIRHKLTSYHNTTPSQVSERIRDATIVITTIVPVTPEDAAQSPGLKLLAIHATGHGWLDKAAFRKLGITVVNCPQTNIASVSEHAIGLYFATRRKTVELHNRTTATDDWEARGTLTRAWIYRPPTCGQESVGIIGYGALGRAIERLARGIGMGGVHICERKGAEKLRSGRIAFEEAIKKTSVLFVCCPKDAETIDLISDRELASMRKDAILINIARGGIVNEAALARALRSGTIAGAAIDVFDKEPAIRGETPLLPLDETAVPNLTVSPHVSWYASQTLDNLYNFLKAGVEGWVAGKPINVIV
ncbi:hypothetical protein MRB53_039740 [Persea americana]|nr:hypothetical protein MRB53_039740 [Persea americana]